MNTEVEKINTKNEGVSRANHERWRNKAKREKTIESLIESWKDPDKKEWRVSRTHSPEAKEKRSESFEKWKEENPERAVTRANVARKALKEKRAEEMKDCLGDNPQEALEELALKECLSSEEIAEKIGKSVEMTRFYLKRYKVELIHVTHLSREEVERRKGIYYWGDTFGLVQNLINEFPKVMDRLYETGREKKVQAKVGREFGLTRQRVEQIESKSLKILENLIDSMSF